MGNSHFMISVIWLTIVSCQQLPHMGSYGVMQRSQRKHGPMDTMRVSFPSYHNSRSTPNRAKQGVPSYAVQMEPLVQYSQPDPLYTIEKQFLNEAKPLDTSSNDLIKAAYSSPVGVVGGIMEAESISRVGQITHARLRPPTHMYPPRPPRPSRGRPPLSHLKPPSDLAPLTMYGPPEIPEPPEPIIEIIIRESNESLPAPDPLPTPPPPKKVKEPVQVFYVKYSKDPSGGYGGEEKVIYDPPVPAVTPPENNDDPEEEAPEPEPVIEPYYDEATAAPPAPSTTLKAIIRPDSETFHSQSGVKITFGQGDEENDEGPSGGGDGPSGPAPYPASSGMDTPFGHESAPQPAVVLPNYSAKPHISRSSVGETSTITKRNPSPYNGQQQHFSNGPQAGGPSNFQQLPNNLPPQDFQPPSVNPSQYSTLSHQNFQSQKLTPNVGQQPQRYTTINNPPPISHNPQYQTINQPGPSQAPPAFQQFHQASNNNNQQQQHQQQQQQHQQRNQPPRFTPQDQHQQQVEQVNRLQQQQQQLQQQLAQHHRFQQPQFPPQLSQPPPLTTHFSQQPSQQIPFPQHQQQHQNHNQFQQQPPQQHHQHHQQQFQNGPRLQHQQQRPQNHQQQGRQPPNLQYPSSNLDSRNVNHASQMHNHRFESHSTYVPTARPLTPTPSPAQQYFRTTSPSTTTEEVTEIVTEDPKKLEEKNKKLEEKKKKNIANLPDEVPDDLRQQLLSSGILSNADIEILDYDKIGDIPIENLPPEALANFQQAAGSERVQVVRRPPPRADDREDSDSEPAASDLRPVTVNTEDGEMEMKVVRFNPDKDGVEQYMKKDATHVAPVVLNDNKYNRYLPLQVSGAQFPVPDIPELRGRNVSSVVVLAPVNYEFLNRRDEAADARVGRSAAPVLEVQGVHFIAGDVLKTLVRMPSAENYRRWLQVENTTSVDKQSVVLLVVGPGPNHPKKEIFMYDISSGRVSKLRGELSSTFVQVAESNSNNQDLDEIADADLASKRPTRRIPKT